MLQHELITDEPDIRASNSIVLCIMLYMFKPPSFGYENENISPGGMPDGRENATRPRAESKMCYTTSRFVA